VEPSEAGPSVRVTASVPVTHSEYLAVSDKSTKTSAGGAGTIAEAVTSRAIA
jgi:hypothetical protein